VQPAVRAKRAARKRRPLGAFSRGAKGLDSARLIRAKARPTLFGTESIFGVKKETDQDAELADSSDHGGR
jgi:hypothetical protein